MKRMQTLSLGILLSMISFVSAHEGDDLYDHHGMMGYWGGMYGMSIFGWLFMTLVVVALVLLIIWLIKQIQEPKRRK